MGISQVHYHGPGGLVAHAGDVWPSGRGALQAFRNVMRGLRAPGQTYQDPGFLRPESA